MSESVQTKILAILSPTEWLTRSQLAKALGRPKALASNDISMLERLVRDGKAEKRPKAYHGVQTRWEYRKL